ncbi:hypothetical protein [Zwartia sp.]|uniref:hypothetical protein n=1 Tax=Zwartia sp. TaxID=2978004 RepID=UPI00272676C7|nr:hypothetical protein [Zwartia sp.]MDO9025289.1 hypothetical protein [Zwartia sp.]
MKNATDILIEAIELHGLPSEVGAIGRISEYIKYAIHGDQTPIIQSSEGLKGWVVISNEDEQNFSDFDSLQYVIQAFIEGWTSGEDLLCRDKNGVEHFLELSANNLDTKSYDFEILIDDDDFRDIFFKATGDFPDSDEDLDLMDFCTNYCHEIEWEKYVTLGYEAAWLKFSDGFELGFTANGDVIVAIDQ